MKIRIKDAKLDHLIEDIHVSKYGVYYFFKNFIISEINSDVVYTWSEAQDAIAAAYKHYGDNPSICYISNRVNDYSVKPTDWLKFFKQNSLKGYAVVTHSKKGFHNVIIEKLFIKSKVEYFDNLFDAIEWANYAVLQ